MSTNGRFHYDLGRGEHAMGLSQVRTATGGTWVFLLYFFATTYHLTTSKKTSRTSQFDGISGGFNWLLASCRPWKEVLEEAIKILPTAKNQDTTQSQGSGVAEVVYEKCKKVSQSRTLEASCILSLISFLYSFYSS